VWGSGGWRDIHRVADRAPAQTKKELPGGRLGGFWWLGLGFEYWPEEGAPDSPEWMDGLAVFIARAGVSAYSLGNETPSTRWSVPASGPISSYAFADLDGRPGQELVLGRLDGFIEVMDREGNVIRTWPTRGPVSDLCAWKAGPTVIAAAMSDHVRFYRGDGGEAGRVALSAERLTTLRAGGISLLICAGREGVITALEASRGEDEKRPTRRRY